jgi:Second Messenger Oligonucleotide or Dinucleotide Synthetase domain
MRPRAVDFQPYFDGFLTNLALDPTREGRIASAVRHLSEIVAGDPLLRRRRPRLVLQGSYATGLAVRPLRASDEYDVDVVLELTVGATASSAATLDWLHTRLANDAVFRTRLRRHPRCVRIEYAGDFHLDIIPGRRIYTPGGAFRGVIKAPDRERGWRTSYPRGFLRWCARQERRTGRDFGRVVVMLKRWRDLQGPDRRRIRSIVFTTLVGRCVPTWSHAGDSSRPDADIVVETLARLDRYVHSRPRVPIVRNPSLPSENLARAWPQTHFEEFRAQIRAAAVAADAARRGVDPRLWRRLFGDGFPARI